MKKMPLLFTAIFLIANCTIKAQTTSTSATASTVSERPMAKEGEKVWVLVNHIKADKRQQFEKFINEIFWPMASKLSADDQRLFRQTRVLYPTKAEADGTYSYLFIMDPVIEGANYDIDSLLVKMYGEQKGKEYSKMLGETSVGNQTEYLVTQSRY